MKLLLDTHAFIWWVSEPSRLSSAAKAAIQSPANEVWISSASIWEMVIKSQLGKLTLHLPVAEIVTVQQANGLKILPITLEHVLAVEKLPSAHKDPFDRILAAQAVVEDGDLVSSDAIFANYPIRILW